MPKQSIEEQIAIMKAYAEGSLYTGTMNSVKSVNGSKRQAISSILNVLSIRSPRWTGVLEKRLLMRITCFAGTVRERTALHLPIM